MHIPLLAIVMFLVSVVFFCRAFYMLGQCHAYKDVRNLLSKARKDAVDEA